MAQLCNSPKPRLKRSPRCMQIDLLPLIARDMAVTNMARPPGRPNRSNPNISPVVWDEKLGLWTRNGKSLPSLQNSKVDHSFQELSQTTLNHTNEQTLLGQTGNDKESSNDMHLSAMSTSHDGFSHINIANAAGRAWVSSMMDVPNYYGKGEITPLARAVECENYPEETSQLLHGVESLCTNLRCWDPAKQGQYDHEKLYSHRSSRLPDCQHCPTQILTCDEDEDFTRIHEKYFVEPTVNKLLKLCPAFISPWFNPDIHPFSDSQKTQNSSPNWSLDWTGEETVDGDEGQGFDGLGLRPQLEGTRVRSRQHWNGDNPTSSGRHVRQRVDNPRNNIISNEFLDNYDGFEPGDNITRWFPQPGDIMITKGLRRQDHLSPGGHVTLYKDEDFFLHTGEARELRRTQYNFQDGDFVVRLGKFSQDWIWHPSPRIEAFLCDLRQVRPWWLVARTYNNDLQPPEYRFDIFRAPVNSVDRTFCPRSGDLVVRAVPGEYKWGLYWWNMYFNFSPCDLVLRVGYETRANGTCMVVELYYRELDDRDWSFRGRDVWTYLSRLTPRPD